MKSYLAVVRTLSISVILAILTNSAGYVRAAFSSDDDPKCGEWKIEGGGTASDQRIMVTSTPVTENNCPGLFTLRNQTDINIGDISLGGGYTMQLNASSSNAQTQFLLYDDPFIPFLFPGLDIEIKTLPNSFDQQALVNLEGRLSLSAFTFDLTFFTIKSLLAFANIPCGIPTEQIFLASNRAAPLLNDSAQLAFNGDLVGSYNEFSAVLQVFNEKLYDFFKDAIVDCSVETLKPKHLAPFQAKILYAYLTWMPVVIFDYLQYEGAPVSYSFVYTPVAAAGPSQVDWIAFLNEKNLWLIHPDGSGLTPIITNDVENTHVQEFHWSPDGETLAYSMNISDETSIVLYDVQDLERTTLITNVGSGFDWDSTGEQIIYETPFGDPDPWSNNGLMMIDVKSKTLDWSLPSTAEHPGFMHPKLSSGGKYVLFEIPAWEPAGYGVANLDTGEIVVLPLNPQGGIGAGNCVWLSQDRLEIACVTIDDSARPAKPVLLLLDVNGNVVEKLILPERMSGNSHVVRSPSGDELAISYPLKTDEWLDIVSLEKNDIKPLASGYVSDWSSDGKWLITWEIGLDHPAPFSISIVNVDSGKSFPLAKGDGLTALWQP